VIGSLNRTELARVRRSTRRLVAFNAACCLVTLVLLAGHVRGWWAL
jgi:hypothetical protein